MSRLDRTFIVLASLTLAAPVLAQFSPGPNPITGTVTTPETLSGGNGTINSGAQISIASGSAVPLTMFGTATLINNGTIQTFGTGRAIDSNTGIANLNITNNGLISSVSSDAFRVNTNSAVSLINLGTIRVTNGGQAIDWAAITSANNALFNLSGGIISAVAEDAVRPGTGGIVANSGTISATPTVSGAGVVSGSDGIDLRTFTGISVGNNGTITGRHGIATDGANTGPSTFGLHNAAGGLVAAINGSALNIDGVSATVTATVANDFGATLRGGVLATALDGDGDGIDVDGVLTLINDGDILGLGARGGTNNAEGVAAGGGSIENNGRIIGSSLALDAPNGDISRAGNGILIDNSNGGNAVASTQVTNVGLIQGKSGFGIKLIGTFADTITNNPGGTIRGAGTGAAIQTGGGNDRLTNRGAIVSDIGNAIDLEDGDDRLEIEGSAASIAGNVAGGAGDDSVFVSLGDGNNLVYSGVLSSFNSVELQSGTLTLDGANRIDSATALLLTGGSLALANVTGANAQTFASLSLNGDATLDLGFSSITFDLLAGIGANPTLTVIDWSSATSPDYAFRFLGDTTASSAFMSLVSGTTINGLAAIFSFDGQFTNVNAVPIPGAFALFASGLGLLGLGRRRRRTAGNS